MGHHVAAKARQPVLADVMRQPGQRRLDHHIVVAGIEESLQALAHGPRAADQRDLNSGPRLSGLQFAIRCLKVAEKMHRTGHCRRASRRPHSARPEAGTSGVYSVRACSRASASVSAITRIGETTFRRLVLPPRAASRLPRPQDGRCSSRGAWPVIIGCELEIGDLPGARGLADRTEESRFHARRRPQVVSRSIL